MCPPNNTAHGFDALDYEIGFQEYLDEEFDTCDYLDLERPIAISKSDLVILQHNIRWSHQKRIVL